MDEFEEEGGRYKPYQSVYGNGIALTFRMHLKTNEILLFPYTNFYPTKLTKQKANYFTLNLTGGSLNLILHLKNFDKEERKKFVQTLADHQMERIFEYSDDVMGTNESIISKIEIF